MADIDGGYFTGPVTIFDSSREGGWGGVELPLPNSALNFPAFVGTGTISGVATRNAVGPTTVLLLSMPDSVPYALKDTDGSGAYSFTNLPAGEYAVVITDPVGGFRSKVAHTVVA